MRRRQPGVTLTDTLVPYTTLFRSCGLFREISGKPEPLARAGVGRDRVRLARPGRVGRAAGHRASHRPYRGFFRLASGRRRPGPALARNRSEEHTSELQSLMRNSYAVFFLKKKKKSTKQHTA